jgi:hypothetical protein
MPPLKGKIPPRLITYKGESKTLSEWAGDIGVPPKVLRSRLSQYDKGLSTLDDVMTRPYVRQSTPQEKSLRHRAIDRLFESFTKNLLPHLDDEMKSYKLTGDLGPAMLFYKHYRPYFCLESYDKQLEKDHPMLATVVNIVTTQPPDTITVDATSQRT